MNPPVADALSEEDPRIAEAILQYLEAREADTPLDEETWLSSHPEEIRPALRSFLVNQAVVARAARQQAATGGSDDVKPFGCYSDFVFLAEGGMGVIYRCRDTRLQRPIAVKILHRRLMSLADMRARFREEAQVASQLLHPNIAPVHEFGETPDGRPYFTMKLVEGQTLSVSIREYHAHPTDEKFERLLRDFVSICHGVEFAHRCGVLHRDLKPANVMIGRFGEVLVMDWGLTKVVGIRTQVDADPSRSSIRTQRSEVPLEASQPGIRGTPAYMPPEQASGSTSLDARCDVFALGAILCQILTGRPAYLSDNPDPRERTRELIEQARSGAVASVFAQLDARRDPAEIVQLAKQCLSFAPNDRPATAQAVADAVIAYQTSAQRRVEEARIGEARAQAEALGERRRRRWQLALGGALLLIITGAVSGGMWYRYDREKKRLAEESVAQNRRTEVSHEIELIDLHIGNEEWPQALGRLHRAEGRLHDGEPADLAAVLTSQRLDLEIVDTLNEISSRTGYFNNNGLNFKETYDLYLACFRKYGVDLQTMTLDQAAERISNSRIREQLVVAIDLWGGVARMAKARHVGLEFDLLKIKDEDRSANELFFSLVQRVDPNPWRTHVRSAARQKDPAAMRQLLAPDEIAKQPPGSLRVAATALRNLVELERGKGHEDLLFQVLQAAVIRYPGDFLLNLQLGANIFDLRPPGFSFEDGIGYFRAAAAIRPQSTVLRGMIAGVLIERKQYRRAITELDAAIALSPGMPQLYTFKAVALRYLGKDRESDELFAKAISFGRGLATTYAIQALLLVQHEKPGPALEKARAAVAADPTDRRALMAISFALSLSGKHAEAVEIGDRVVAANPESAISYVMRGAARYEKGDFKPAADDFRKALELEPQIPLAHAGLGTVHFQLQQWEQAKREFEIELANNPECVEALMGLGNTLYELKNSFEALPLLEKAATLGPYNSKAQYNAGYVNSKLLRFDKAIPYLEAAAKLNPSDPYCHYHLGYCCFQKKKFAQSVEAFRRYVEAKPGEYDGHILLASSLLSDGKFREAKDRLETGRKLMPALDPRQAELDRTQRVIAILMKLEPEPFADVASELGRLGNAKSWSRLARDCRENLKFFACAARLYRDAFESDSALAGEHDFLEPATYRYAALACALLAASGQGKDAAKLREGEITLLRNMARRWFREEIDLQIGLSKSPNDWRASIRDNLIRWKKDPDLASIREKDALAKLPAAERKEWQILWAEVDELLKKVEAAKPNPGDRKN